MAAVSDEPVHTYTFDAVTLPDRAGVFSLTLADGTITSIAPSRQSAAGWLALPGLVNLHAHADRAYSAQSFRPKTFADAVA